MMKEKIREMEGMEGARRATGMPSIERSKEEGEIAVKMVPDPEVTEKAARRRFSAKYKLRVLEMADACTEPGSLGALLRREGLYHSNLTTWRLRRDKGILSGLAPKKRGRKEMKQNPLQSEVNQLRKENERLKNRLKQAEIIIDVQKKVSQMLNVPLESTEEGRKN